MHRAVWNNHPRIHRNVFQSSGTGRSQFTRSPQPPPPNLKNVGIETILQQFAWNNLPTPKKMEFASYALETPRGLQVMVSMLDARDYHGSNNWAIGVPQAPWFDLPKSVIDLIIRKLKQNQREIQQQIQEMDDDRANMGWVWTQAWQDQRDNYVKRIDYINDDIIEAFKRKHKKYDVSSSILIRRSTRDPNRAYLDLSPQHGFDRWRRAAQRELVSNMAPPLQGQHRLPHVPQRLIREFISHTGQTAPMLPNMPARFGKKKRKQRV